MLTTQEPKYDVNKDGRLVNRFSGEVIPDDEPVFVLRARDMKAAQAILDYGDSCSDKEHREVVHGRYHDFMAFAKNHPERMKEPDTDTKR